MTYAIGDVHGCNATLKALLDKIDPQPDDTLVFVGDYCDRGPDTYGVIETVLALRETHRVVCLIGNHEEMWKNATNGHAADLWLYNGGRDTIASYARRDLPCPSDAHADFLESLKLYHETDTHFFCHATPNVYQDVPQEHERTLLWNRNGLGSGSPLWEKTVVCGHTPQKHGKPWEAENVVCIDTGCVFGPERGYGVLTALCCETGEYVQQESIDPPIN